MCEECEFVGTFFLFRTCTSNCMIKTDSEQRYLGNPTCTSLQLIIRVFSNNRHLHDRLWSVCVTLVHCTSLKQSIQKIIKHNYKTFSKHKVH